MHAELAEKPAKSQKPRKPRRPRGVGRRAKWDPKAGVWRDGEFWFDEWSADRAVEFFPRYLKFTQGEWAGRPFVLEAWEEDHIIRPLFGWKCADGSRRYQRCIVWIPRKNGKTELAAGIALLLLIGDKEPAAEVYAIASNQRQAEIVFKKAKSMVIASPELSEILECFKPSIYCNETDSLFQPLAGVGKGSHGFNMSGLIGDEMHEWRNDELLQFMHDSSQARRQPLEFLISTAGDAGTYGHELWLESLSICDGSIDDPRTLVVIYAADEDADIYSEETWHAANPNLGVSKKLDRMRLDAKAAKRSPRAEAHFKKYQLNIWTEQAVRWLPIDAIDDDGNKWGWKYCAGEVGWRDLETLLDRKECYSGIDLSSTQDLSALIHLFPVQKGLELPTVLCRFFKPRTLLDVHGKRDRLPYRQWADDGALFATPGNVVDYDFIKGVLFEDAERFEIRNIGVDPHNATNTVIDIENQGLPVEYFRQGFLSLNAPSKELERLTVSNGFIHGNHPILFRHARVVAVETDSAGNIKPTKGKSTERIDGIAALVNAIGVLVGEKGGASRLTSEKISSRGGLL